MNCDQCSFAGGRHEWKCDRLTRPVVLELTIEVVTRKLLESTGEDIEWHDNEGTGCLSNYLAELDDRLAEQEGLMGESCICSFSTVKYLGEATPFEAKVGLVNWGELPPEIRERR